MTVAELTAVGLPAAYVPLPIGNGEQRLNAGPVVARRRRAAGRRRRPAPPTGSGDTLPAARATPTGWPPWAAAAAELGRPDADERLVDLVARRPRRRAGARVSRR